jgi:chorismate mutase
MAEESVRALRGATTVDVDDPEQIGVRACELIDSMLQRNGLENDQIISIFFTATTDLTSAFPATAVRTGGYDDVPLICAQEIPVPGSLPRCIRVMMHVSTSASRDDLTHVYLHDAVGLRDDKQR